MSCGVTWCHHHVAHQVAHQSHMHFQPWIRKGPPHHPPPDGIVKASHVPMISCQHLSNGSVWLDHNWEASSAISSQQVMLQEASLGPATCSDATREAIRGRVCSHHEPWDLIGDLIWDCMYECHVTERWRRFPKEKKKINTQIYPIIIIIAIVIKIPPCERVYSHWLVVSCFFFPQGWWTWPCCTSPTAS